MVWARTAHRLTDNAALFLLPMSIKLVHDVVADDVDGGRVGPEPDPPSALADDHGGDMLLPKSVKLVYHFMTSSHTTSPEGGLDQCLGPHNAPAHGQGGTSSAVNVHQAGT